MSTTYTPQGLGHFDLASGNVAIVETVRITDPAHLPCGGPATPGIWGEVSHIEDPGGYFIRGFGDAFDDGEPAYIDPPETIDEPAGPGDYFHLDAQYAA